MQTMLTICVVGLGSMGRAYMRRFEACGIKTRGIFEQQVSASSFARNELILLAVRSGRDALQVISSMEGRGASIVLNLTTQAVPDTCDCIKLASSLGVSYFGGGTTGGASQTASGESTILIGPAPPPTILDLISHIGNVIVCPSAEAATAAKLLHNLVLIIQNHAIAVSMVLADRVGVGNLDHILDIGTAGRKPSLSSAVRDHASKPVSSYTSTLVAKDICALLASFPDLKQVAGLDLNAMADFYQAGGNHPYTDTALRAILR